MKRINKKGSLFDIIFIIIVLVFFSMVVLIGLNIAQNFNNQIQTMADVPAEGKTATDSAVNNYTGVINGGFLFLVIGMMIATLVLAALVLVHPIFIPIYFIEWVITIIIGGIASNIYQEMATSSQLQSTANSLPILYFVLGYLPIIVGVLGIVLMIVLYKTASWSQ